MRPPAPPARVVKPVQTAAARLGELRLMGREWRALRTRLETMARLASEHGRDGRGGRR